MILLSRCSDFLGIAGWPVHPVVQAMARHSKKASTAAVIIEGDGGRVLLLQRGETAPWMPGKWNLPGGLVENNETPAEAAVREAYEESNLKLESLQFISATPIAGLPGEKLHIFYTNVWTGKPKINWESQALKWVPITKAWKEDLVPPLKKIFKELAA